MRWAAFAVLLTGGGAAAQPPAAGPYLGAPAGQSFNEKAMFPNAVAAPAAAPKVTPPLVYSPDPPPPPKIWSGGFEFGLNGSQGNANVTNLRLGTSADRKTDDNRFHLDFLYTLSKQDGTTSQNQALLNARDEILFHGTPWSVFSALQVEYDQFRAYDLKVGNYAGFAYTWVKTDTTFFTTRLGAGAIREISTKAGGPPDRTVPEAVLGYDFSHKFTDRQGCMSSVDVYPSLSHLGEYRVRARAGYEIVIAPEHGMVLRLGVQDRYDSNPVQGRRNDVNYFATLLFKF